VLLRRKRAGRLRHEMRAKCTITRKEGKNILRLKKIIASLRSTREGDVATMDTHRWSAEFHQEIKR